MEQKVDLQEEKTETGQLRPARLVLRAAIWRREPNLDKQEMRSMNWLSQAFAQYSIIWLLITTFMSLVVAALTNVGAYYLKKKEIVDSVVEEIKKQRQLQAIAQEKEREDRIREQIVLWAPPISRAVGDLEHRLRNILYRGGGLALSQEGLDHPGWTITYDYFMPSTLYLFALYFARIEMLWEELSFELFHSEQDRNEFFKAINTVSRALGKYSTQDPKDKQVFRLQQRAIGELLVFPNSDPSKLYRCMSYLDFLRKWEDESFKPHLEPLRALLENVSFQSKHECRWTRLEETRNALTKLSEQCNQVLKLPEK